MWGDVLLLSLVGGLIAADQTSAFQLMISRPIVAAPLIGLLLGDPATGLIVGSLLELIWMGRPPLGGAILPNACLCSIVMTGSTIMASSLLEYPPTERQLIALGFIIGLPLARLAAFMEAKLRLINGFLALKAEAGVARGRTRHLAALNMTGLGAFYLASALFILITSILLTHILVFLYPKLPYFMHFTLDLMYLFIPLIGVSVVLSGLNVKRARIYFALSYYLLFIILLW